MANTTSSITGTVVSDVVTFNTQNCANGVTLYIKYDKGNGTSATITFTIKNPKLSTDSYNFWDSTSLTVASETFTFDASGNFRIPLGIALDETVLVATVAYTGGTTQTMAVNALFGG
jgi:hypothetical protein